MTLDRVDDTASLSAIKRTTVNFSERLIAIRVVKEAALLRTLAMYQERMLEIAGRADTCLATGDEAAIATLGRDRATMARLMVSYQLFVHREIFAPMTTSTIPSDVANARSLKAECIALASEFVEYTRHWGGRDLRAEWEEYAPLARTMVARIRAHVNGVRRLAPSFLEGKVLTDRTRYVT